MLILCKQKVNLMNYKNLKIEVKDSVAILTISRPEALNALNSNFFDEMKMFLKSLQSDKQIKVLIISGEGKAFVAGADIAEMVNKNTEQALEFSKTGQNTFETIENLSIPVIAAINGFALGGGCELAMACDIRIASEKAKFGQPEVNLGLIPGYAGTQRLSRLVGLGNALNLILSGEAISAQEALRIGLVQKVVQPEELLAETWKLAETIASKGSNAIRQAKIAIRKGFNLNFKEASELEANTFASLFGKPEATEGMTAFLEKRKPNW